MPGIGDPQNRYDEINSNKTHLKINYIHELKHVTFPK